MYAGEDFAHLNTSHVNLQLRKRVDTIKRDRDLNTSHVNLQPYADALAAVEGDNLNTSHVNLQRTKTLSQEL